MKMKKNIQFCIKTVLVVFIINSFFGCASIKDKNDLQNYRDKIAELESINSLDSDKLSEVLEAYNQLRAMGELSEEEYEEMIEIASILNMNELEYELLVESYHLYPTKEKAFQIEEYIILIEEENLEPLDDFYKQVNGKADEYLNGYTPLKELVFSESWTDLFQFEEGMLNKNTLVKVGDKVWQISQSKLKCDVFYYDDHSFLYFSILENGNGQMFSGDFLNNKVDGKFRFYRYSDEDTCYLAVDGTIKDNLIIDEFSVKTKDVTYSGTLDQQGHVTTSQNKKVPHLIYAYDSTNKKYLYIENAKQNEFVMDAQFWKFPQIEIWDLN